MNETTKKCTMCGQEKLQEDFRQYPNGKRYPYCLECQSIETRRRYLEQIEEAQGLTDEQQDELNAIRALYEARIEAGLKTFGTRQTKSVKDIVATQMKALRKE